MHLEKYFMFFFRINAKIINNLSTRISEPYRVISKAGVSEGIVFVYDFQPLYNVFRNSSKFFPRAPDPNLTDKIIYARYFAGEEDNLMRALPHQKCYLLSWKPLKGRKKSFQLQEILESPGT